MSNPQQLHKTIERLLYKSRGSDGKPAERVLYRQDGSTVLIQSWVSAPDWASYKLMYPDYFDGKPVTKDVYPKFENGQIWLYRCKVNTAHPRNCGKASRNGIYLAEAQLNWWTKHTPKLGFRVLSATASPGKVKFAGSRTTITLAVATFTGFLEITDATIFEATFRNGIGRGRAYGLGMLSLFPAR